MPDTHDDNHRITTAACVQFDVHRGDVSKNLTAATEGIEAAVTAGAQLCVLPEMWSTSFDHDYDSAVIEAAAAAELELQALSDKHDLVIIGSSLEAADGGFYNSARIYDNGQHLGSYRKLHMFSPNAEQKHHQSGQTPLCVDTRLGRIGVLIGYDLRFPELARHYLHMGAEILVVPAQWPEPRSQHWRTLLRARAIESGLFVIGSNRTGQETALKGEETHSFVGDGRIVDPTGEILAAGTGDGGVMTADLELRIVRTLRRVLPIDRDQRPTVYRQMLDDAWESMQTVSRENETPDKNN